MLWGDREIQIKIKNKIESIKLLQEYPSVAEEKVHAILLTSHVVVETWNHYSQQLTEVTLKMKGKRTYHCTFLYPQKKKKDTFDKYYIMLFIYIYYLML